MTVCEMLGLHSLVRARRLKFRMHEDAHLSGHMVPYRDHAGHLSPAIGHTDGLGCVRCLHFEPTSGSPSHPPTTTRAART